MNERRLREAGRRGQCGILLALLACLSHCAEPSGSRDPTSTLEPRFLDRLAESGIDFITRHGGSGDKQFPEVNLGGVSLFDADGDGRLDVLLCQGAPLPGNHEPLESFQSRLYLNEGDFRFRDVTATAGLVAEDYCFSAACPDLDGDGDLDLFLCNYGANRLLLNDGTGKFQDVTEQAGFSAEEWTSAAAFFDIDQDGDLDLYLANYVVYDLDDPVICGEIERGPEYRSYCHPDTCAGRADRFYRNEGVRDGVPRFRECTEEVGCAGADGKGLALVPFDFDSDGDVDLYVANDATANYLWQNEGGTFQEIGVQRGVAQNGAGRNESCMGSDAADVDGDGDLDLFSANMANETNTLWTNDGEFFVDDTAFSGLAQDSLLWVGFGARFLDYDLDMDPDLVIANGHVVDNVKLYDPHQTFPQPAQLFENLGRGKFRLVRHEAGPYFAEERRVGRGLALGDLDDDGDADIVIANLTGHPALLENRTQRPQATPRPWIGLDLRTRTANTRALGTQVKLQAGGHTQIAEVRGAASYAAWSDTRLIFALGEANHADEIEIRWPDGTKQTLRDLEGGKYWRVEQE